MPKMEGTARGGGSDYRGGLRSPRAEGARPEPACGSGGGPRRRTQPLSAHKGARVGEPIEECDSELIYLPPYSPGMNPTDEAFSKVEGLLARSRSPHPRGAGRDDGSGGALSAVTAQDASGFFSHHGYRTTAQLL